MDKMPSREEMEAMIEKAKREWQAKLDAMGESVFALPADSALLIGAGRALDAILADAGV